MYEVRCDNEVCRSVVLEGPNGRPTLTGKRNVWCKRCQGFVEQVEEEVRRQATHKALVLAEEVDELRKKLMKEHFPESISADKGPREGTSEWPKIG